MEKISQPLRGLLARVNNINQVCGIKRFTYAEGKARGMEAAEVTSGAGLRFVVLPERGMSIGEASFMGVNMAYMSKNGVSSPEYLGVDGSHFARAYVGGLLFTCGLTQAGAACRDNGEQLFTHGAAGAIKPDNYYAVTDISDGMPVMRVSGELRESRLFGENIVLKRTITVNYGENIIHVNDEAINEGYKTSPFMIIYHCNIGYPMLSPCAEFYTSGSKAHAVNDITAGELDKYTSFTEPDDDYFERVYSHELTGDTDAVYAGIKNTQLGVDLRISFNKNELGELLEWKSMGSGDYALGIEPANCRVSGRAGERAAGRLKHIEPGEIIRTSLSIEFNRL